METSGAVGCLSSSHSSTDMRPSYGKAVKSSLKTLGFTLWILGYLTGLVNGLQNHDSVHKLQRGQVAG